METYYCPLSLLIFVDPVIAKDGHTYERNEIETWFKKNYTSPITGLHLEDKTLISNVSLKNLVNEYLEKNPSEKQNQYKYHKEYIFNKELITELILNEDYESLVQFTEYDLYDMGYLYVKGYQNALDNITEKCDNFSVIKHIFDSADRICSLKNRSHYMINFLAGKIVSCNKKAKSSYFRNYNKDILFNKDYTKYIEYFVSKGLNFKEFYDGSSLFDMVIMHIYICCSSDLIIDLIEREILNYNQVLCKNCNPLPVASDYNKDLICAYLGIMPIHIVCIRREYNLIKYFIEKIDKADLKVKTGIFHSCYSFYIGRNQSLIELICQNGLLTNDKKKKLANEIMEKMMT